MLREIVLVPAMLGGLMAVATTPAPAMDFCADRAAMVKSLSDTYRENPTAVGQIDGNAVIEIFVSEKGSWTILATRTDGKSCVVSAGEGWEVNLAALGDGA